MAKIGYLGHSCFQIDIGGNRLIIDPFITPNPLAQSLDFTKLKADVILVTHGHQDHTADLLALADQTGALVVANFEIATWVSNHGYNHVLGMNTGGVFSDGDLSVKMVNALHSSSFADGTYAGNPSGFVIKDNDYCIYYAGDTGLHMEMKLIGEMENIDLAILPIGDIFTMGYKDASKAAEFVGTNSIIGMHYNTFPPIKINEQEVKDYFKSKGQEIKLLPIGAEEQFNR